MVQGQKGQVGPFHFHFGKSQLYVFFPVSGFRALPQNPADSRPSWHHLTGFREPFSVVFPRKDSGPPLPQNYVNLFYHSSLFVTSHLSQCGSCPLPIHHESMFFFVTFSRVFPAFHCSHAVLQTLSFAPSTHIN